MPTPLHPLNDEVYPIPGPRFVSIVALPLDLRDPLDITGLPLDIRDTGDITGLPLDLQNTAEISQNFTAGKLLIGDGTNPIAESAFMTEQPNGGAPYFYVNPQLNANVTGGIGAIYSEADVNVSGAANAWRSGVYGVTYTFNAAEIDIAAGVVGSGGTSGTSIVHRFPALWAQMPASNGGTTLEYAMGLGVSPVTNGGSLGNAHIFLSNTPGSTLADAPAGDWAIYSASTLGSQLLGSVFVGDFDGGTTDWSSLTAGGFQSLSLGGDLVQGQAAVGSTFLRVLSAAGAGFTAVATGTPGVFVSDIDLTISRTGGDIFKVTNATGNVMLNGVDYAFPAADAAGTLNSDGSGSLSWGAGTGGTVTSIAAGDGIDCTPDPIIATGTVAVDASVVRTSRTIATTLPLTGGGDLSANRTLAISDFVASGASHARGAVPDPGSTPGTTKFLREDATWALPPVATVTGTGTAGQATFWTSSTNISSDAAFLWDNTNKRLGIGGTPSVQLHTTSRAILASGLADPASNGQTLLQVGDASGGIDASWRYGITYSGVISDLPASGGFYGMFSYAKSTSTSTPNFIVGGHMGAETTTTMTAVEGYAGTAGAVNGSGSITLNNVRASYVSPYTSGAGTKAMTNMFGSWCAPQLDGAGAATITNLFNYKADNSQTASFGQGVGRLTAGVITNLYGYLYTHPTTGTVTNEYAFYAEATATGNAAASWQTYNAGTYSQTGYLGTGGVGAGAKSYFGARVGVGCTDPISQLEIDNTGFPQSPSGLIVSYHANDVVPPPITFLKSRGTRSAPTAVADADWIGLTYSAGYDGTNPVTSCYYGSIVDDTVSAGNVPMAWFVATGTDNNPQEHMRVDSVGAVTGTAQPGAAAYNTTDQTIPNTVLTAMAFDTNEWTQGGATAVHDGATNNDRFVAPVSGIYMAECQVSFNAGPSACAVTIAKHGASTTNIATSGVMGGTVAHASTIVKLIAGEYLVFGALQVSAGNADTIAGAQYTFGRLMKLW